MAKGKEKIVPPVEEAKVEAPAVGPKWVKVTQEQLMKLQNEGKLIGYRPETSEAYIK